MFESIIMDEQIACGKMYIKPRRNLQIMTWSVGWKEIFYTYWAAVICRRTGKLSDYAGSSPDLPQKKANQVV